MPTNAKTRKTYRVTVDARMVQEIVRAEIEKHAEELRRALGVN